MAKGITIIAAASLLPVLHLMFPYLVSLYRTDCALFSPAAKFVLDWIRQHSSFWLHVFHVRVAGICKELPRSWNMCSGVLWQGCIFISLKSCKPTVILKIWARAPQYSTGINPAFLSCSSVETLHPGFIGIPEVAAGFIDAHLLYRCV